jgi:ATP-dependent RNA helicase RhlE
MTSFHDFNLPKALLQALDEGGFTAPTPIQSAVLPVALSGVDLVGVAATGTGKTLAYLLPSLKKWTFSKDLQPQILVVVPTRELALQVGEVARNLTAYMTFRTGIAYGGVPMNRQMDIVRDGCDLLVATPGRLLDFMLKGLIRMKGLKILVMDEVDEMLELGLRHQLIHILDLLPDKRQNLLFTATYSTDIQVLAHGYLREHVQVATDGRAVERIRLTAYETPNFYSKANLLSWLLQDPSRMPRVLVFAGTRRRADLLHAYLSQGSTERIGLIHASKAQQNRMLTLDDFREGAYRVLIASDLLSRGMDIPDVTHVINFDLPESAEGFIHRVGRTARAGLQGEAISFLAPGEDILLNDIEDYLQEPIPRLIWPDEVPLAEELLREEEPTVRMKNPAANQPDKPSGQGAFQAKKERITPARTPSRGAQRFLKDKKKGPSRKRK